MTPISDVFANSYLACALVAVAAVFIRLARPLSSEQRFLSIALLLPLVVVYLAGMHRSAGVDFDNYIAAYDETGQSIPDIGYTAITWVTRRIGIDFPMFLMLQGAFTIATMWFVAKTKDADPVVVVAVYLLHLAIVRDMSQSRIALAVAIYLIGQTRRRKIPKAVLYVAAASVHITTIVVMLVWALASTGARWSRPRQVMFIYLPFIVFAVLGVGLLDLLSFFDPRIEIYLAWDDAAYGAPLDSFGALVRSVLVLTVYFVATRRFKELDLRNYIIVELAGAAILIGFSQFSIFAARLSNVAISMYPIGLGLIACAYQRYPMQPRALLLGAAIKLALFVTLAALVLRPGSFDALREVVPTAYEAASDWE